MDETAFKETLNTNIPAATPAPPEPAHPEPALPEPVAPDNPAGENDITLGEDGELSIPDSFWDDMGLDAGTEKPEPAHPEPAHPEPAHPEPAPAPVAHYTPEEFGAAFAAGTIDEARLSPDIAKFYSAAMAKVQPPQAPQMPQQQPAAMTPQQYTMLRDAAKRVAAKNYLGINPDEFDEMDPSHLEAQRFAMGQIQTRAQEIATARAAEAARAQQLASEIGSLDAEYRQKDPEFFEKHESVMRHYIQRMPYSAAVEAIWAIQTGDIANIKKFLNDVYQDYKKGRPAPVRPAPVTPPAVMKAGGGPAENKNTGVVDAEELTGMSPDEQADWLLKNGFAKIA
jgi:hypothetical protein